MSPTGAEKEARQIRQGEEEWGKGGSNLPSLTRARRGGRSHKKTPGASRSALGATSDSSDPFAQHRNTVSGRYAAPQDPPTHGRGANKSALADIREFEEKHMDTTKRMQEQLRAAKEFENFYADQKKITDLRR